MKFSGVIFDFNGTLFFDTDKQEEAWRLMYRKIHRRDIAPTEFQDHFHGRVNSELMNYFVGKNASAAERAAISRAKEEAYREVVRSKPEDIHFVKGAESLLDELRRREIPFTIATASEITNVRFFFEIFPLNRWFSSPEAIVYDNGTFPGKPAPDIYLRAAEKIQRSPAQCLVVEDSLMGLTAAKNAGIGTVLAMNPVLDRAKILADPAIQGVLTDYCDFAEKYLS